MARPPLPCRENRKFLAAQRGGGHNGDKGVLLVVHAKVSSGALARVLVGLGRSPTRARACVRSVPELTLACTHPLPQTPPSVLPKLAVLRNRSLRMPARRASRQQGA